MTSQSNLVKRLLSASGPLARAATRGARGACPRPDECGACARPGAAVTFRAELMPGRNAADRTFRVARVLPAGRLLIEGLAGEHAVAEFEPGRAVARLAQAKRVGQAAPHLNVVSQY